MPFDPDAFLAEGSTPQQKSGFDPDAFLAEGSAPQPPQERGVLERAGEAAAGTFKSGLSAGKKLFTPRTQEEKEEGYGAVGALKGLKETAQGLVSPLTMTAGPLISGGQSLIASGMGALQRGAQRGITGVVRKYDPEKAAELESRIPTSEQAYRTWEPNVGTAMLAIPAGRAGIGRPPPIGELVPPELGRAIVRDADTPAAINQRLAEAKQIRPEATVADVAGENTRGVLEGIAQTPGAGRSTVVPFLEARQKAQMSRIADDLVGATGTKQTAFRAVEDTMAARKQTAAPLYEKAYADGDFAIWEQSPELQQVASAPFVQSAMRKAVTTWRNQAVADGYGSMNPPHVPTVGRETGNISFQGVTQVPVQPNLQFWDYTKRMLDDQTSSALRAGQNQKARVLTTLTQQLRTAVDAQVPSYAAARNAWSGPSRYIDAIEDGRSIFNRNLTSEEFTANFNALSEAEKEGQRIGIVGAVLQKMRANPAKLADFTSIMRSPDMREKLAAIMPTPEAAERFRRGLDFEVRSSELTRGALGNSKTALRQAMQAEGQNTAVEIIKEIALPSHTIRGLLMRSLHKGSKMARDTMRSKADKRIADVLTSKRGLPLPRGNPIGSPSVPAAGIAGGAYTVDNPKRFKKGGRVTKTFRYADGGEVQQSLSDLFSSQGAAFNAASRGGGPGTGEPSDAELQQAHDTFWNAAATPENISAASQLGAILKTSAEGSPLQSSGPQGGWFPGDFHESSTSQQYNAPTGLQKPSTNNWRLLPQGYNTPQYVMRNGHIIDRYFAQNPASYLIQHGASAEPGMGGVGIGPGGIFAPLSAGAYGTQATRGYFWPGQIEPWETMTGIQGKRGGRIQGKKKGGRVTKDFRYADGGEVPGPDAPTAPPQTLADIFQSQGQTNPLSSTLSDAQYWSQPATPDMQQYAVDHGAHYLPQQQSSGEDGGWFQGDASRQNSGDPGFNSQVATGITRGMFPGWQGMPNFSAPSTNNPRLLPPGYNSGNYIMRNGEIIDRRILGNPSAWGPWAGMPTSGEHTLYRIGGPFPINVSGAYAGHGPASGGWPGSIQGLHQTSQTQWVKRGGRIKGLPKVPK